MRKKGIRKAVMAVILKQDGTILIGSSPRDGGYKFPQGGRNPNEDVISAVKRELFEELGVKITDDSILARYSKKVYYNYPPEDPYFIFEGQELSVVKIAYSPSQQYTPQDDEFEKLVWIFPSDLHKYDTQFRNKAYHQALVLCDLL